MPTIPLLHTHRFDRRKIFRYSGAFLILTAIVLIIQNYIRYSGHSSYVPSIGGSYLMISVLGFIPVILVA